MERINDIRIARIDWMKVIGMYFIILGHFFPRGYVYIYVFNVPVFYIISGYLCKKEESSLLFWKKIVLNYTLPLFFICTAMFLWNYFSWDKNDRYIKSIYFLYYALIGSQKCLGTGWFIYTLIILKIIFQYLPSTTISNLFSICLFSFISVLFQHYNIHHFNAIENVAIAYPVFLIGHLLSKRRKTINKFHDAKILLVLSLFTIITIYFCGKTNGEVWVYNNDYGRSFILFIIGSISGTILLYAISVMMEKRFSSTIQTLSVGNIITLGFHPIIIALIGPQGGFIDYATSFIILLSFYPITLLAQKYFPYILGAKYINNKNE